jgi:hypothetical protein
MHVMTEPFGYKGFLARACLQETPGDIGDCTPVPSDPLATTPSHKFYAAPESPPLPPPLRPPPTECGQGTLNPGGFSALSTHCVTKQRAGIDTHYNGITVFNM